MRCQRQSGPTNDEHHLRSQTRSSSPRKLPAISICLIRYVTISSTNRKPYSADWPTSAMAGPHDFLSRSSGTLDPSPSLFPSLFFSLSLSYQPLGICLEAAISMLNNPKPPDRRALGRWAHRVRGRPRPAVSSPRSCGGRFTCSVPSCKVLIDEKGLEECQSCNLDAFESLTC